MFREEGARQILLFPEGTNLSQSSAKKSDEYAVKNNLNKYNHVLHPRTSGLYCTVYSKYTSCTIMFCILEHQVCTVYSVF